MVRNLGLRVAPLLEQIVAQILSIYEVHGHSSCLYLAGKVIEGFSTVPEYVQPFFQMFDALSKSTFTRLSSSTTAMQECTDHVEDYCRLLNEVLKGSPMMLYQTELGPHAFQFGVHAVLVHSKRVHIQLVDTMRRFVAGPTVQDHVMKCDHAEMVPHIEKLLMTYGEALVHNIILGITGGLPAFYFAYTVDLLWAVHRVSPEQCVHWVGTAMQLPQLAGGLATPEHKDQLVQGLRVPTPDLRIFREDIVRPFHRLFRPANDGD